MKKLFKLAALALTAALCFTACQTETSPTTTDTPQKTAGSISYASTTVSKTTDDEAFTNELTKTGDGTVTYSSSDDSVATVNASTGEVTIVGAGTATITATVADSESYTYETTTASYTLTVTQAGFSVALPESVGENPFAGKSYDYEEGFMGTTPGRVVFTDSTLTITNKKNHKWVFQYTYDATQKLIYCGWVSESANGATIYTVSDYVNMYKNELVTDDTISYYTDKGTAYYTTMKIYNYEQTDSSLTMSEGYFTGALPSCAEFEIPNSGSSPYNISYDNGGFTINDNNSSSKSKYHLFVLCNENPFSATLYQKLNGEYAKVGTAKGSYTATGTGISDCTLKITFTELPDEVTVITKNTEYTLPQHQKSITEMTLSN